jgi:hypothetical protein
LATPTQPHPSQLAAVAHHRAGSDLSACDTFSSNSLSQSILVWSFFLIYFLLFSHHCIYLCQLTCQFVLWVLHWMDSQGTMRDVSPSKQASASSGLPPAPSGEFPTQRHAMAPPQFFPGFPSVPGQMPFLFPHSFMPPVPGMGFPPTAHGPAPPSSTCPRAPKNVDHKKN